MKRITLASLLLGAALSLGGCHEDTPQEQIADKLSRSPKSFLCAVEDHVNSTAPALSVASVLQTVPVLSPVVKNDLPKTIPFTANSAPRKHRANQVNGNILTVYFTTDHSSFNSNDTADLETYLQSLPNGTHLLVEGYADRRGTDEHNALLSQQRAQAVSDYAKRFNPTLETELYSFGEGHPAVEGKGFKTYQANRRVRIIPQKSEGVITTGLSTLKPSDYYLLDRTGSMKDIQWNRVSKWNEVQSYQFPKGASLYTFTTNNVTKGCTGEDLNQLTPDGETPLFVSLYSLLDEMKEGRSVTVLTDGINNVGDVSDKDIIERARAKKITLSFLALVPCDKDRLTYLAKETGGDTYLPIEKE
ncbi:MAG: OmpA family protein [Candidatus Woesearchaeota archaeon]|jgi:outer membrane protein OmpA-like peptidoglycan-associated protein